MKKKKQEETTLLLELDLLSMQQQEEWYYGGSYGQQQRLSPSVPDYGHLNSSAPSSSSPSLVLLPNAPPYSAYATPSYAQAYDYGLGSSQQQQQQVYGGVEEGGAQAMSLGYGAPSSLDNYYGGQQDATSSIYAKPYDGGGGSGEVFVYDGGRGGAGAGGGGASEPYGARGTGASSWSSRNTDDAKDSAGAGGEEGGVQKYWVKLLPETTSSNPPKEVICQIGLDGVRMVDPSTSRTLRIYPLETIERWEVNEPSVFTFWAKSAVDFEQCTIRLQSSTHTINAILDTITAACVQLCEMVGKDGPSNYSKPSDSSAGAGTDISRHQKGSIVDWVSLRPRAVSEEEKQHWVPDEAASKCTNCKTEFSAFIRRHHCRNCGDIFCDKCTRGRTALTAGEDAQVVRVCDHCLGEVMQRLSNVKETSSKTSVRHTHEDLAKKLQEELERNASRKAARNSQSSSTNTNSSATSVLNCTKCGSISLVPSNSTQCPSCGFKVSEEHGRGQESGAGSFGSSPQFSSHFWSNSPAPQGSGPRMQEVACPTCTVHLQVQLPSSGTETIECGVCQHPFLVNAN